MTQELYIKIDGKPLELNNGSALQIQEQNPYLQFSDQLQGDYSYPIDIPLTPANKKLFNHPQLLPVKDKTSATTNVTIGDNLEQLYGILRKEQIIANLNGTGNDSMSMYFLKGWSSFYKDVQTKTLLNINYGAEEVYYAVGNAGNGFVPELLHHFTDVMFNGNIDRFNYALFPVFNSSRATGVVGPDDLYKIYNYAYVRLDDGVVVHQWTPPYQSIYPYINFLIKCIFKTFGWTVDGFIFDDPDFKKLVLLQTGVPDSARDFINGYYHIRMRDNVPAIPISTFLIGLKNRFGWWYDFDASRKNCTIRKQNIFFGQNKRLDITRFVNPKYTSKINTAKKVFAISAGGDAPDKTSWASEDSVNIFSQLPAAAEALQGQVYLVQAENQYYICDTTVPFGDVYAWTVLQQNDFGHVPANNSAWIYQGSVNVFTDLPAPALESAKYVYLVLASNRYYLCDSTVPNGIVYEWQELPDDDFGFILASDTQNITSSCQIPITKIMDLFNGHLDSQGKICIPEIALEEDNSNVDSFYVCYSHGVQPSIPGAGQPVKMYPFGSPAPFNLAGARVSNFSLTYEFLLADGSDIGLYKVFWKQFLDRLQYDETIEIEVFLPHAVMLGMNWQDTVLINNVEYIIQQRNRNIPYSNSLTLTIQRIQ